MSPAHRTFWLVWALVGVLATASRTPLFAVVWHVDVQVGGVQDGASWATAFPELQSALAVAQSGDEIWVAAGTYYPDFDVVTGVHSGNREATFQLRSGVALYGGFVGTETNREERDPAAHETVLSGDLGANEAPDCLADGTRGPSQRDRRDCLRYDNSYHVVTCIGTDETAVLDGFTITRGHADGLHEQGLAQGGGLYLVGASPTITNCAFMRNASDSGGGAVFNLEGSPTLERCTFRENITGFRNQGTAIAQIDAGGGGMQNVLGNPVLRDCTFADNTVVTGGGGGMNNLSSSPTLIGCTFTRNESNPAGGGMLNFNGSSPTAIRCIFDGNNAVVSGGGVYNRLNSHATLSHCILAGNTGSGGGGGGLFNTESNPVITNCLFSGNSGGGGGGALNWMAGDMRFTNCTFSANSAGTGGGVLKTGGSMSLTNCILWGNRAFGPTEETMQIEGGRPVIRFSCIQGLSRFTGHGNMGEDPIFRDADGPDDEIGTLDDDARLSAASPCIDAGNSGVVSYALDLDEKPRHVDIWAAPDVGRGFPVVDMGAYETHEDCNGNGVPDEQDILIGSSVDCNANGVPDACERDCNGNGVVDDCDLAAGVGQDTNRNRVLDECEPVFLAFMDESGAVLATGSSDTLISPRSEDRPLDRFVVQATHDLGLVSLETSGTQRRAAQVEEWINEGDGLHTVRLSRHIVPGNWLNILLNLVGETSGAPVTLEVWLAHHPSDIDQNGTVDIHDATAFGELFRGEAAPPMLLDLNGDGTVNVRDATEFGRMWRGEPPATRTWEGSRLPERP